MEGGLDGVEVPDHRSQVDARQIQFAMRDPVPRLIMPHRHGVGSSPACGAVKHHRGTAFEDQAGQSRIIGIVKVPSATDLPICVGAAATDGVAACVVDGLLQLTPTQDEIGLIIKGLVDADTLGLCIRCALSRCFKIAVDPRVESIEPRQILHCKARWKLSAVKTTSSSRARNAAMCQDGSAKISDLSLMTKCPVEPIRSTRPLDPMIQR